MGATVALASEASLRNVRRARWMRARIGRSLWVAPYAFALLVFLFVAGFADVIAPYDPGAQSLSSRLARPAFLADGNANYLLGADALGRDVFSRILMGARASLIVGVVGVLIGASIGTGVGIVAAYRGGRTDDVLMSIADIQLSFPTIMLAIAVVAVLGPSLTNLLLVVGISGWMTYARVCRSVTFRLKAEDYVLAVRALGGDDKRILIRHILPNLVPTQIVLATLDMPRLIMLEATLSFLGLGIQPPTPTWGGMVSEGRTYLDTAWWISVGPGMALLVATLSINRVGDWLRALLDPRMSASG